MGHVSSQTRIKSICGFNTILLGEMLVLDVDKDVSNYPLSAASFGVPIPERCSPN
jgi:hypothetical protein